MTSFRRSPITTTPPEAPTPDDDLAVERYEYLLRTAPPDTIEQAHAEAFGKLTPEQLDVLFERFTKDADNPADRPSDARPQTLARTATRAEVQAPGTMSRLFGFGNGYPGSSYFAGSILDGIAGYVIGSAIASALFPVSYGLDNEPNDPAQASAMTGADVPAQDSIDAYFLDGLSADGF